MSVVFFVGMAGSGKTSLVAALSSWLHLKEQKMCLVNLDPGAIDLPYIPDVDVRDRIDLKGIMGDYGLGPNAALVVAADMIAGEMGSITEQVEGAQADLVLVDTPGQIELFAFRASSPYIVENISKESKCVIFLLDSIFASDPLGYVVNALLSSAVYTRLLCPQINVLSKADLIGKDSTWRIINWSGSEMSLIESMRPLLDGQRFLLGKEIARATSKLRFVGTPIPVSSKTQQGFVDLHSEMTRILRHGEEATS